MNKSTHVIFLGAFTLAFGFIACSAAEDIENSATAGHTSTAGSPGTGGGPATGTGGTGSAGRASAGAPATSSAGRPATSSGGSSATIDPNTPSSSTSNGCSLGLRAASNGALGGIALGLALALVARRRRVGKPSDSC